MRLYETGGDMTYLSYKIKRSLDMNQMFNPHENLRKWPKVVWAEGLQPWHQEVRSPWPGQSERCSPCSKPPEPRVQIERDGFGPKAIETGGKCTGKLQNPMVYHVPTKWLDGHLWRYTGIGWYRYIPFFWHTHLATGLSKIPRAPIERVCPRLTLGFAAPGHADSCSRPQGYPWNHPTASNEI